MRFTTLTIVPVFLAFSAFLLLLPDEAVVTGQRVIADASDDRHEQEVLNTTLKFKNEPPPAEDEDTGSVLDRMEVSVLDHSIESDQPNGAIVTGDVVKERVVISQSRHTVEGERSTQGSVQIDPPRLLSLDERLSQMEAMVRDTGDFSDDLIAAEEDINGVFKQPGLSAALLSRPICGADICRVSGTFESDTEAHRLVDVLTDAVGWNSQVESYFDMTVDGGVVATIYISRPGRNIPVVD